MIRWIVFGVLAALHAAVAAFAPPVLAPAVAGSVYLPLMLFQAIGIPALANAPSGGWAAPSLLGWALVVALWAAVWWGVATLLIKLVASVRAQ